MFVKVFFILLGTGIALGQDHEVPQMGPPPYFNLGQIIDTLQAYSKLAGQKGNMMGLSISGLTQAKIAAAFNRYMPEYAVKELEAQYNFEQSRKEFIQVFWDAKDYLRKSGELNQAFSPALRYMRPIQNDFDISNKNMLKAYCGHSGFVA